MDPTRVQLCADIRFNQMLLQVIKVPRWFLINIFLPFCFSQCLIQPMVKVDDAYDRDVLLLKQLLPDSVKLLATYSFQRTTRAQEH